jgi:hypothetical protein
MHLYDRDQQYEEQHEDGEELVVVGPEGEGPQADLQADQRHQEHTDHQAVGK